MFLNLSEEYFQPMKILQLIRVKESVSPKIRSNQEYPLIFI